MEKIYLLLRDNKESGPFTIDELLQQQLRETDLIWVEGKSLAWGYPHEIRDLQEYFFPGVQKKSVKRKPQPSRPDDIEIRAEALRQRVFTHQRPAYSPPVYRDPEQDTPYLDYREEGEGFEVVDHRKAKTFSMNELLAAAMVAVIVGIGIYGGQSFLSQNRNQEPVVTRVITSEDNTARSPFMETVFQPDEEDMQQIPALDSSRSGWAGYQPEERKTEAPVAVSGAYEEPVQVSEGYSPATNAAVPADELRISRNQEQAVEETVVKSREPVKKAATEPEEKKKDTTRKKEKSEEQAEEVSEEPARKKKLGETLKNIFKKKRDAEDTSSGE